MISFIIIGRNEGWKLTKCIESVFETIKHNKLYDYEVIYVDSKSTDDSIKRAVKFKDVKIFKITSKHNAAIGRNIGAKESNGDVLFFVDGDMEIDPNFMPLVFNEKDGLKYSFVSGQVENINRDTDGDVINKTYQFKNLNDDKYYSTTGGIFFIKKELWEKVNGMDIRFRRGQDHDLALRLTKIGYPLLRKKEIIANHNTIPYTHTSRMWNMLFSGDISYSISFLLRKHLFNLFVYKNFISANYTTITMIISILVAIILNSIWFIFGYLLVLIVKIVKNKKMGICNNIELLMYYFVRDMLILYYLFVPIKQIDKNKIKYVRVYT